jgi:hypothetical protein
LENWKLYRFHVPVASLLVEMATQSRYGVVLTENCCRTQRWASESQRTVPSPSLLVWQPPPNPLKRVLVLRADKTTPPDLLKTSNCWLTSSMY